MQRWEGAQHSVRLSVFSMWFGPRPSLPTTPVLRSWLYSHLKSHLSTEQSSLPFLPEKRKYPIPREHQLGNVTPYTKQSSVREIQHPTFCQAHISFLSATCLFIIFCSFTSRSQTSFGGPLKVFYYIMNLKLMAVALVFLVSVWWTLLVVHKWDCKTIHPVYLSPNFFHR